MRSISLNKSRLFLFLLLVAIAAGALCYLFIAPSSSKTHEQIVDYTLEYSEKHKILAPGDSMLAQLKAERGVDSLSYLNSRAFCRRMFLNGNQVGSFEYLKECIAIIHSYPGLSVETRTFEAYCYLLLGAASDEIGLRTISHDYYEEGLKIADAVGNLSLQGDFLNNIGVSYFRAENFKKSEEYLVRALEIGKKLNNKGLINISYSNISEIYALQGDYARALDCSLKAIQYIDEARMPAEFYSVQTNIGQLYLEKGDVAMGLSYLRNSFANLEKIGSRTYLFENAMVQADHYQKNHAADSLGKYLDIAHTLATEMRNQEMTGRVLEKKSEIAAAAGDMATAFRIEKEIVALKDSADKVQNTARMEQANNIYNMEREDLKRSASSIAGWNPVVVFISMSALVGVLVCLFVWILLIRRRKEELVREKAEAVAKYAELQQSQLMEEMEQKARISEDLTAQQGKLTSFTLERIRANELVEEISTDVKKLILETSSRQKEAHGKLKQILVRLSALKSDSQWEEFQYYFERVNPSFYKRLDELHPGLTAKDRRLCALLSLGLSSKDIASVTFREVRSVESSRNRLRKKLNLESDESLFEYMKSLSGSPLISPAVTAEGAD